MYQKDLIVFLKLQFGVGGNDGGYWFEYKNYNKETNEFNIVIYNDISGKILIKSNFVLKK